MAKFFLVGDEEAGRPYIPYAVTALRRLRSTNRTTGNHTVYKDDYVTVRVVLDRVPQWDRVYIESKQFSLNCFLDTFPILPPKRINSEGAPIPYHPFQYGQQATEENRYIVPPAEVADISLYGIRLVGTTIEQENPEEPQAPGELTLTKKLPVEPNFTGIPGLPDQTDVRYREVVEWFMPSKFTGLMRGAMQMALSGENSWLSILDVPVDYRHGNCHGIIKNPANNQYYLVKFTLDSVWYVPCDFKVVNTDKTTRPVLIMGSVDKLNPVKIGDIPTKSRHSWGSETSWAFSYTLPQASIVAVSDIRIGNSTYHTTALATANFSFDTQTGDPSGVGITSTAHKIFWNSHLMTGEAPTVIDWGLFNVPRYGTENVGSHPTWYHESFDFGRGRPVGLGPRQMPYSNYSVYELPVHVYYSPDGQKHLVAYNFEASSGNFHDRYWWTVDGAGEKPGDLDPKINTQTRPVHQISVTVSPYFDNNFNITHDGSLVQKTETRYETYDAAADQWSSMASGIASGMGWSSVEATSLSGVEMSHSSGLVSQGTVGYLPMTMNTDGTIGGFFYPAGTSITVGGYTSSLFRQFGQVPLVETQVTVTTRYKQFDSSLTLPLTDREAALVYTRADSWTEVLRYGSNGFDPSFTNGTETIYDDPRHTLTLHGATAPITVPYEPFADDSYLLVLHPFYSSLQYKACKSAFSVTNRAYQTTPGTGGAPVVFISGIEYDVQHRLWCWLGIS